MRAWDFAQESGGIFPPEYATSENINFNKIKDLFDCFGGNIRKNSFKGYYD